MTHKFGVVILARMSSSRFPGKVITPLAGMPILQILVTRLVENGFDRASNIVVATSRHESDDPLVEFCDACEINCYRGPLENVLERFVAASQFYGFDFAFRVNADSPFVAAPLLRKAIELCEGQSNVDLISNVRRRYWPYGIACELISIDAARQLLVTFPIDKGGKPTGYHEHITSAFYAAPEKFNILDLVPDNNLPDMSGAPALTVDEPTDVERLERLLADYDRSPVTFTYTDLVNRR